MKAAVIGGGASGAFAAIFLGRGGAHVTVYEKNEKIGKKLYITGKGRCNLTNDCTADEVLQNVVHGEKFLRSAVYSFPPEMTKEFFESAGLRLKTERGGRVFPESDKSSDVIKTLLKEMAKAKVNVKLNSEVTDIYKAEDGFTVVANGESEKFDAVLIATGGMSYPSTGSTGDGIKIAKTFGLKTSAFKQSLVPLNVSESVSELEGISLKNVTLTASIAGKVIGSEFGEMLFTRRGLSGPIALTLSSLIEDTGGVTLTLDLKPAIDESTLNARILREFDERKNMDLKNATRALLIERLNLYVLKRAGLNEYKKVNSVTKEEREHLIKTIKNLQFKLSGFGSFNEAIISRGGVALCDLKPSMESKTVPHLYFIGETVDADALTGGYNLQIAFSTAYAASKNILKELKATL